MALPMTQIGEHAAKLLLSMIENGNANQPVHEIERFADWHLVVRESTAQVSA
jgi:DNA-binding LacI/PurR family transcriptional regulator